MDNGKKADTPSADEKAMACPHQHSDSGHGLQKGNAEAIAFPSQHSDSGHELEKVCNRLSALETWLRALTFSIVILVLLLAMGVALSWGRVSPLHSSSCSLPLEPKREDSAQAVRLIVQRSSDSTSGFKLPKGESPESLANFLDEYRQVRYSLTRTGLPTLYVSIATPNRFEEGLLDRGQLQEVGQVDGFLFVWITSPEKCTSSNLHAEIRRFLHERLNSFAPVGFVCWTVNDSYFRNTFIDDSLSSLEREMFRSLPFQDKLK